MLSSLVLTIRKIRKFKITFPRFRWDIYFWNPQNWISATLGIQAKNNILFQDEKLRKSHYIVDKLWKQKSILWKKFIYRNFESQEHPKLPYLQLEGTYISLVYKVTGIFIIKSIAKHGCVPCFYSLTVFKGIAV